MLSLQGVSKQYPGSDVYATRDVSLEVPTGQFLTLLGPSGCGKTTLLRMIGGLESVSKGKVMLNGADITHSSADKRPMGMVFQSYALFPHMTVEKNIGYGLRARQVDRPEREQRVREAIESMGLKQLASRMPGQLSGGQQQRVALARALVTRPKVMLFDEPLSNLDAKLREQMRFEIRRIHNEYGITSIYVTHDQIEALSISDRIVVLDNGVIAQDGKPEAIYDNPKSSYVADFIGETYFLESGGPIQEDVAGGLVAPLGHAEWRVKLAEGVPKAELAGSWQIALRPEDLMVRSVGGKGVIDGRVVSVAFKGSYSEARVETSWGTVAIQLDREEGARLEAEDTVGVALRDGRCGVLFGVGLERPT